MSKLDVSLAALVLTLCCHTLRASIVTDCASGDASGKILGIQLNDCDFDEDDSCKLIRGQNSSIKVDFSSSKELTVVKVKLAGKKGAALLPFDLNPEDACGNWGFDCPIKANEQKTLAISMPILTIYPKMKVEIQVKLVDQNDKDIVCFRAPSEIIDP